MSESMCTKITQYYPASPQKIITIKDDSNLLSEDESQGKSIDLEAISSVLLTPESTPTKQNGTTSSSGSDNEDKETKPEITDLLINDKPTEEPIKEDEDLKKSPKDVKVEETKTQVKHEPVVLSPAPVVVNGKKARKGRWRGKPSQKDTSKTTEEKPKTKSAKKSKPVENNRLVTDFFPIRRSARVPASQIKKMEQQKIEEAILSNKEDGLKIENFPLKGRGVVATQMFKKGEFVVEYAGDLVNLETAKQRDMEYTGKTDVGCYMYYFQHQDKSYCIDATAESGKLGRLLNHSKTNPNCCTRVVSMGERPYLIIVAARDIEIGEELLYDYGDRNKETLAANPWLAY